MDELLETGEIDDKEFALLTSAIARNQKDLHFSPPHQRDMQTEVHEQLARLPFIEVPTPTQSSRAAPKYTFVLLHSFCL